MKIIGWDGDRSVSDDSDLITISERLRLVSISEEEEEKSEDSVAACSSGDAISDEELARMLQVSYSILLVLSGCLVLFFVLILTFGDAFIVRQKRMHLCFSNLLPLTMGTK